MSGVLLLPRATLATIDAAAATASAAAGIAADRANATLSTAASKLPTAIATTSCMLERIPERLRLRSVSRLVP